MTLNNAKKGCKYSITDITADEKIMKGLRLLGLSGALR